MSDLKIKLFSILNSIGPSMSAQQSEDISEAFNELDRLRAEVVSLKEELAATQSVGLRYARENDDLTQQLAAAHGRVEKCLNVMLEIKQHAEFKADRNADCDYVELSGIQGGQLLCILDLVNASLSDLPQQSEDARDGYVPVPITPDDRLITAMAIAYENSPAHDLISPMEDAYAAMVAAISAQENKS